MEDVLFSVLIANYNNSEFLTECIQSVYKQTYRNWEIIFVDDFSKDNSLEIIEGFASKDSRIHIFKNPKNKGCGYTKKYCIDMANGELCGFLDSDDVLAEDAIELMVKVHLEQPDVSIIGSRRIFCDFNMKILDVAPSLVDKVKNFKTLLDTPFLITHFVSFKKSAYLNTQGIDSSLLRAVDQDLYYKLEEVGKVAFIDKPLYYYRNNSNSISLNDNRYKADAWHLCIIKDVCTRRHLSFDNYCSLMKKTKSRKEKLINLFFLPYTNIKKLLTCKSHIRKFYETPKTSENPVVVVSNFSGGGEKNLKFNRH